MRKTPLLKIIAVLLICLFGIQSTGFAASTSDTVVSAHEKEVELVELRTTDSKTYRLSDGTFRYVGYAEDVHYKDSYGKLVEIDNTIINSVEKDGYVFRSAANSWKAFFSNKLCDLNAVFLEKDDYSLSFSMPFANQQITARKSVDMIDSEASFYGDIKTDNRVVVYQEVFTGVDVVYTVKTLGIKEDIILKNAASPRSFEFAITADGLTAIERDGTVYFQDEAGNNVFHIGALYMTDANGKYSEAVTWSLNQVKNGYDLVISASDEFLNAGDTVYPVIIDPSIMVTGTSNTFDTCVDEQYPSSNYYSSENLWTGGATGTNRMRTYIKFNMPSGISASQVTSATLRIKKRAYQAPTIRGYRVTSSWSPSSVTWNNQLGYTITNGTSIITLDTGSWYKLNTTTLVKYWLAGTYSNYGFILKEPSESSSSQKTKYYSSDAPSPNKPELIIEYSNYPINTVSVRKITDETYREEYSSYTTKINDYMSDIATPFSAKWNIEFSHYSWVSNTTLPAVDCTLANNECCHEHMDVCGYTCQDGTAIPNHHKNHYRNWSLLYNNGKGSSDITIGFLGFTPCAAGGLSAEWLSTVCQPNLSYWTDNYNRRTIQHEISHLFGCDDESCTSGQSCIMSGGFDNVASMNQNSIWCDQCTNSFNRVSH